MKAMESRLNETPHVVAYNHVSKHIEWCVFDHAEITLLDRLNIIHNIALQVHRCVSFSNRRMWDT